MKNRNMPFFSGSDDHCPPWEYHAHSRFSDGSATVATVIAQAEKAGITRLIFTEHTEPDLTTGTDWFQRYIAEVRQQRQGRGLQVAVGLEVPITDYGGSLLMDPEMAEPLDFLLGAVHAYPGHGWDVGLLEPQRAVEMEYRGLMALAENPHIDAIAHPGGVCHKYATPFPLELFETVVKKATSNGIAIELNPGYHDPMAPYLAICRRHGALISPGSNAHHPHEIGRAWRILEELMAKTPPPPT